MRGSRIKLTITMICLGAYAFFGWHARYGARSFAYQAAVQDRLEQTRARLEQVRARRKRLEARNALLRAESLDPDMLDETARRMLGFAGPREQITFLSQGKGGHAPR